VIGGAGLIDVELANPLDTFAGARGEQSAREFGTLGYSIRARRSTWATAAHRMVTGRSSAKRMRPGKQSVPAQGPRWNLQANLRFIKERGVEGKTLLEVAVASEPSRSSRSRPVWLER